jgi:hypothetical protein
MWQAGIARPKCVKSGAELELPIKRKPEEKRAARVRGTIGHSVKGCRLMTPQANPQGSGPAIGSSAEAVGLDHLIPRDQQPAFLAERGLKVSKQTLAQHAMRGSGPKYRVVGRTAYSTVRELLEWADALTSNPCRSAAERRLATAGK